MPINSKQKGKAGELEWVKWLKENLGINARRGQQFKGTPDSPDIICDLEAVHWEVKRVQNLNLAKAMEQAVNDASECQIPVVAHRRNHSEWLITVPAKHLVNFSKEIRSAVDGISA